MASALAVVSLAVSWVSLGVPAHQPAQASTTDLLSCKFGPAQVFDVQWNISGGILNVSSITRPYASDGQLSEAELDSTDYFKFANSTNGGTPSLSFTQWSSADSAKRTLHTWGNFRAIGEDFIFHTGGGFNGTVITTGQGFSYGNSASLAITTENPPLDEVLAYSSCSSTPLAAGESNESAPPEEPETEGDTSVVNEPAIGLDLRADVGGRADGARFDIIGLSLPAGTTYSLSVYSPTRTIVSRLVGANGRFSGLIPVPQDLGVGRHVVVLQALLRSRQALELHRDFTIGGDGAFTSVGQSTVGPAGVDPRLAYTGVQSSSLPLWALTSVSLGLALVLQSARARRIVELAGVAAPGIAARTPWEILSTPIRVPGIDYVPDGGVSGAESVSLAETMKELNLAFSRMIVCGIDSLQVHIATR